MATTGYSGTPLVKKLGIKEGFTIRLFHEPEDYFRLVPDIPFNVQISTDPAVPKDMIHFFSISAYELRRYIPSLRSELKPDGMIWVSWTKKASKVPTDVTEDLIREIALSNGLVDVKVCVIDETWSGLKLVIPIKDRTH